MTAGAKTANDAANASTVRRMTPPFAWLWVPRGSIVPRPRFGRGPPADVVASAGPKRAKAKEIRMKGPFLLVALLSVACGSVADSTPVGINLKAKSTDVRAEVINDEKGISTESGNPYKVFMDTARARLAGRDPSKIKITKMTLTLGAGTTGVVALNEVFAGNVDVQFIVDDTNNSFPVGTFSNPAGGGPVGSSSITFDS